MSQASSPTRSRQDVDGVGVARAAGVSAQAVSNWARRHSGFPRAVWRGSRAGYPASAVARGLTAAIFHALH